MTIIGLKKWIGISYEGPFCCVKELGLHLKGSKEAFAGFQMEAHLDRIFIPARVYFDSSLVGDRGAAETLVTKLLAIIQVRYGGDHGKR